MAEFIHSNGTIKSEGEIKADNPNTSFCAGAMSTDTLSELGYTAVLDAPAPSPSASTKVVIRDGAVKNSKDQWVYKWKEQDRHSTYTDSDDKTVTKASQDTAYQTSLDNNQKNGLRLERKSLLEEADWQINKLEDAGSSTSDWKTYRQALRDITEASDIYDVTWPTKPS
jgi:hypothetical protein